MKLLTLERRLNENLHFFRYRRAISDIAALRQRLVEHHAQQQYAIVECTDEKVHFLALDELIVVLLLRIALYYLGKVVILGAGRLKQRDSQHRFESFSRVHVVVVFCWGVS